MAISGAIAGLAGSTLVLGVLYRFITHFSPGYGFTAIAVALVARAPAVGRAARRAYCSARLQAGGMTMQLFARIPADLMTAVQGLVILFVAAPGLLYVVRRCHFASCAPTSGPGGRRRPDKGRSRRGTTDERMRWKSSFISIR